MIKTNYPKWKTFAIFLIVLGGIPFFRFSFFITAVSQEEIIAKWISLFLIIIGIIIFIIINYKDKQKHLLTLSS